MERRPYPGILQIVLSRMFLLILLTALPMFCAAVYVESLHANTWAGSALGVGGIVLLGLVFPRVYRGIPCPACDRTRLAFAKSKCKDRWHLLTCEHCGIEGEMGLGEGHGD